MNKCRGRMIQMDYIMGNIFHQKGRETERDLLVLLEKDQETKEKNSLLGSRTDQLSCLLFSWKTFLNIIITVIKLTESQFFNPSSTNLLTKIHWAKIQYYLGLSLEIMSLQIGVKLIVSCNWWSFPPKWNQWIFPPNAQFFFHYKLGKKKTSTFSLSHFSSSQIATVG